MCSCNTWICLEEGLPITFHIVITRFSFCVIIIIIIILHPTSLWSSIIAAAISYANTVAVDDKRWLGLTKKLGILSNVPHHLAVS